MLSRLPVPWNHQIAALQLSTVQQYPFAFSCRQQEQHPMWQRVRSDCCINTPCPFLSLVAHGSPSGKPHCAITYCWHSIRRALTPILFAPRGYLAQHVEICALARRLCYPVLALNPGISSRGHFVLPLKRSDRALLALSLKNSSSLFPSNENLPLDSG